MSILDIITSGELEKTVLNFCLVRYDAVVNK